MVFLNVRRGTTACFKTKEKGNMSRFKNTVNRSIIITHHTASKVLRFSPAAPTVVFVTLNLSVMFQTGQNYHPDNFHFNNFPPSTSHQSPPVFTAIHRVPTGRSAGHWLTSLCHCFCYLTNGQRWCSSENFLNFFTIFNLTFRARQNKFMAVKMHTSNVILLA